MSEFICTKKSYVPNTNQITPHPWFFDNLENAAPMAWTLQGLRSKLIQVCEGIVETGNRIDCPRWSNLFLFVCTWSALSCRMMQNVVRGRLADVTILRKLFYVSQYCCPFWLTDRNLESERQKASERAQRLVAKIILILSLKWRFIDDAMRSQTKNGSCERKNDAKSRQDIVKQIDYDWK